MISKLERLLSGGTVTWDRLLVTDGLSPEAVEQITAVSPAAPDRVWAVSYTHLTLPTSFTV